MVSLKTREIRAAAPSPAITFIGLLWVMIAMTTRIADTQDYLGNMYISLYRSALRRGTDIVLVVENIEKSIGGTQYNIHN